MVDRI